MPPLRWVLLLSLGACGRIGFADHRDASVGSSDARMADAATTPIQLVQTHADASANTNVLSTTFPNPVAVGDTIIVGIDFDHGGSEPGVAITDNAGRTYTLAAGPNPFNGFTEYLAYAFVTTGGPTTITTTLTQNSNLFFELKAFELAGLAKSAPVDQSGENFGTAAAAGAVKSPTVTTTGANEVVIGMEVCDCAADPGPGMTVLSTFDSDVVEQVLSPLPGTYQLSAVLQTNGNWRFVVAAFEASDVTSLLCPRSG